MNSTKSIILDLDDTIFETKTLDENFLLPFFDFLSSSLKSSHSPQIITDILKDLYCKPWDEVISYYHIDNLIFDQAIDILDKTNTQLNIRPYPDYEYIKNLNVRKFLVTTSLTSIQQKKLTSLNLDNDFEKIIINDPFKNNLGKFNCFKMLVDEYNLDISQTYVIGDNPFSEIEAANRLGITSIQILRHNVARGNNAKHYINNFYELEDILCDVC